MDELTELHIKGKLSEEGYLKETYDNETNELTHKLTELGTETIKEMFKSNEWRKEFIKLAVEKANKYPNEARQIMINAVNKLKELTNV
jgi:hypothetical protein